ncbi:GNAT family N-acetyltransferase [Nocardiopsis mangrovi]|uniref:GNAT family N-acetyltransferase n=1 Tax=Nocardiopsis mangrovi TaxID=1179818 RepID=A0ABV9DPJ0_9ACTN
MSTQRFVRSARHEDIDAVVDIQVAAWESMYGGLLPDAVRAELAGAEARSRFAAQWGAAVAAPPSPKHRLLVATDADRVAGFAAIAPAQDPDSGPGDAEVIALHVDPAQVRRGHGSRLLNASVDHLVDDGFSAAHLWVLEAANPLRAFAESAGWRADGARRELDLGSPLPMARLHAAIGGTA